MLYSLFPMYYRENDMLRRTGYRDGQRSVGCSYPRCNSGDFLKISMDVHHDQYHHTPPFIANSTIGTQKIGPDSIYRIASVSKALTAYMLLIRDGEKHLNTAVADIIPGLKQLSYNSSTGVLIDWTQVTVADLMSQMSPLGYDCKY